jgi:predicted deacylase
VVHRFGLPSEPPPDQIAKLLRAQTALAPDAAASLDEVLAAMRRVEASVVVGRPAKVPRALLERAATTVRAALAACGVVEAPMELVAPRSLGKNAAGQPASEADEPPP